MGTPMRNVQPLQKRIRWRVFSRPRFFGLRSISDLSRVTGLVTATFAGAALMNGSSRALRPQSNFLTMAHLPGQFETHGITRRVHGGRASCLDGFQHARKRRDEQ
jgi:hypothetical protein